MFRMYGGHDSRSRHVRPLSSDTREPKWVPRRAAPAYGTRAEPSSRLIPHHAYAADSRSESDEDDAVGNSAPNGGYAPHPPEGSESPVQDGDSDKEDDDDGMIEVRRTGVDRESTTTTSTSSITSGLSSQPSVSGASPTRSPVSPPTPTKADDKSIQAMLKDSRVYMYEQAAIGGIYLVMAILYAVMGSINNIQTLTATETLCYYNLLGVSIQILKNNDKLDVWGVVFVAFTVGFLASLAQVLVLWLIEQNVWTNRKDLDTWTPQGKRPIASAARVIQLTILFALGTQQAGSLDEGKQYLLGGILGAAVEAFWVVQEFAPNLKIGLYFMLVTMTYGWVSMGRIAVRALHEQGSRANKYAAVYVSLSFLVTLALVILRFVDVYKWEEQRRKRQNVFWPMFLTDALMLALMVAVFWTMYYQLVNDLPLVGALEGCLLI